MYSRWKENIARAVLECARRGVVPDVVWISGLKISISGLKISISGLKISISGFKILITLRRVPMF